MILVKSFYPLLLSPWLVTKKTKKGLGKFNIFCPTQTMKVQTFNKKLKFMPNPKDY